MLSLQVSHIVNMIGLKDANTIDNMLTMQVITLSD